MRDNAAAGHEELVWTCSVCEKIHRGLPAIAFDAPSLYYRIPEEDRISRAVLTNDTCVIDDEDFLSEEFSKYRSWDIMRCSMGRMVFLERG